MCSISLNTTNSTLSSKTVYRDNSNERNSKAITVFHLFFNTENLSLVSWRVPVCPDHKKNSYLLPSESISGSGRLPRRRSPRKWWLASYLRQRRECSFAPTPAPSFGPWGPGFPVSQNPQSTGNLPKKNKVSGRCARRNNPCVPHVSALASYLPRMPRRYCITTSTTFWSRSTWGRYSSALPEKNPPPWIHTSTGKVPSFFTCEVGVDPPAKRYWKI